MKKKVICWFSCGITSAVACKQAIEKYGRENVIIYYIEIASAHPDNERFIEDCEYWFDMPIQRVRSLKYEDQFDVIEQRRFVNGPGGALCTTELKKLVRFRIQKQYPAGTLQVFGFEFSLKEINRAVRFLQQYPETSPRFPLIESRITKDECAYILAEAGILLPVMYLLGYSNNNCIGCVKGGKGYWNKIRIDFPTYFLRMCELEREVGRTCIKGVFLDELDPNEGRDSKIVLPDCGSICEIKFEDILDERALMIFSDPSEMFALYEVLY